MSGQKPEPATLSELAAIRARIDGAFKQTAALIGAAKRPLPDQTGDGTELPPENDPNILAKLNGILADLVHLGPRNIDTLIKIQEKQTHGDPIDDRTYLMERLIQAAAILPVDSVSSLKVTGGFLTQLWNDLQHPPLSYLGKKYCYRQADGSYNSLMHPNVGAAHTPYARSIKPATMQPGALPDPGVVFDSIMARSPENHEKHPNRISSMLFYFASIIIHDLFRTDHTNVGNSKTSSYLDLSPLYGSVQSEQDQIRTFKDGKIKPDCFSEKRMLALPPGVGCLLIMFNRYHNFVVDQLALINESGRFNKPTDDASAKVYDENLFQTGRLVTCGLYINIILIDYVRTILNLNRTDSNWQLNPRMDFKGGPPIAAGNQVSVEFNLVYRWHSAVSDRDEKWTEDLWEQMFPKRGYKDVGLEEFLRKLAQLDTSLSDDPLKRPFAGLKRSDSNSFKDDDLVKILTESIEDCANSFGARRVPPVMRAIEILGITEARQWNVATLNEFRKFFSLKPYHKFEDINPDKEVAEQLKRLYDHPDLVELYPGLVAEDAKKPMKPGSGLTPSYTVSRAVLSDAVALVRGDRFYTVDYHPKILTNWGFTEVNSDLGIDNGCVFYKLFLRAFPNHFEPNSVYAHYPLTVPSEMRIILDNLKKASMYDFGRPKHSAEPKLVLSYAAAKSILDNQDAFKVTWGKAMEFLMGAPAKNFMLSGDGPANTASRKMMSGALYISNWEQEVKQYYEAMTLKLLKAKSYKIAGVNQVDIIRDIGNLVHVHFCSELFSLPLKTDDFPHGIFTEHEMYLILSGVFICVFFDVDPANSFPLRQKALKATQELGRLVEMNVREISRGGFFSSVMQAIRPSQTPLRDYGMNLIKRLLQSQADAKELVWGHILGTAGGMVPNQGQLFGQALDYLFTEGREHLPEISRLAKLDTVEADTKIMHYLLEASRLYGETGVIRYVTREVDVDDNGTKLHFKPGDKVMVNLKAASHDPKKFPNPDKIDLNRPLESYIHLGHGPHQCLGLPMTRVALTALLKTICKLEKLRPAPGPQGRVHKVTKLFYPGDSLPESFHYHAYLTENHDMYFPFPCSLKVNWDGDLP